MSSLAGAPPEPSYIDYEALLSPTFSAAAHANALVRRTNDSSDTATDLSTPLSKVLFDAQEIDTHIDTHSTRSAQPLLAHAQSQAGSAAAVAAHASASVAALRSRHAALHREVVARHEAAEQVRLAASRVWIAAKIGRAAQRVLVLARRLEADMAQAAGRPDDAAAATVRAAHTLLALKALLAADHPGGEGEHLGRIDAVAAARADLMAPAEARLRARAQATVREFSLAPGAQVAGFAHAADARARTAAACAALYLLSPPPPPGAAFAPALLVQSLEAYLRAALTASASGLGRALAALSTLPRALGEVAARCRGVGALERLLAAADAPEHPLLAHQPAGSLLLPLLDSLDTASLVSYFWRQLASELGPRVHELLGRGGVGARQLRAARERIREAIREAVVKGGEGAARPPGSKGWEREIGVMVGSVVGPIAR